MSNIEFVQELKDVNIILKIIQLCFIILFSNYLFIKIMNIKNISIANIIFNLLIAPIISVVLRILEHEIDSYFSIFTLILIVGLINELYYKKEIIFNLLITMICLSINYVVYIISLMISFIPCSIFKINNDIISFILIILIYTYIMCNILKIKKLRYGINFLQNILKNSYFDLLILNIGGLILFLIIAMQDRLISGSPKLITTFVILSITMFITIKQSFDLYYKQNLLEKDLKETKDELEAKKKEVEKLEKENLEFSKTSHSLAHKQKALEYRLSQLTKLGKINEDEEIDIKNELENISEKMYKEPEDIELAKTDIPSIDNMFSYMQSECIKDNIKFELQVVGNIHYMVNNLISENELEILIADHIKDAIIAINHSDNSNRSILVRIGKIDNVYSLYIYDSGIEFTKEVLDNLGKKPITTHADTGGTGMGFMNTFDTLNKTKASLIINEIGKPCEDNYTKVLIFKFDNQNEFKVNSYKNEVVV